MMKAAYVVIIGVLALFSGACVTGDEITSYVIEPDGAVAFSIYRLNLTSDETGEVEKRDLADYIRGLEERQDDLFAKLDKANAKEVKVTVLRASPQASVLITGRFLSLEDFAAYLSVEGDEQTSLICTPISTGRTRGLLFELFDNSSIEESQAETSTPRSDSIDKTSIALAEGVFTKAEGFVLAHSKRAAILDEDSLSKKLNSQNPSITFSIEWQIPEAP